MSSDRTRDQAKKQIIGCNGFSEEAGTQFEQVLWEDYGSAPRNYRSKVTALRHWLLKPTNATLIEEINQRCKQQSLNIDVKPIVSAILENKPVNLVLKQPATLTETIQQTVPIIPPPSSLVAGPPTDFTKFPPNIPPTTSNFEFHVSTAHSQASFGSGIPPDNMKNPQALAADVNPAGSRIIEPSAVALPSSTLPSPHMEAQPPSLPPTSQADQSSLPPMPPEYHGLAAPSGAPSALALSERSIPLSHLKTDLGLQMWEMPASSDPAQTLQIEPLTAVPPPTEDEPTLVPSLGLIKGTAREQATASQQEETLLVSHAAEASQLSNAAMNPVMIRESNISSSQLSFNEFDPSKETGGAHDSPSMKALEAPPSSVSPPAEETEQVSQPLTQKTNFLPNSPENLILPAHADSLDAATSVAVFPTSTQEDHTYASYNQHHRPSQPLQIIKQPDLAPPPPSNDPLRAPGAAYNWNPPVNATSPQEESTEMKTKDAVTSIYKYKVVIPDTIRLLNEARESTLIHSHEQRKEIEVKGLERSIQKQFERGRELTTMMIEIDGLVRSMTRTLSAAAESWGSSSTTQKHHSQQLQPVGGNPEGGVSSLIESGSTELLNALNQCYEEVRTFREELEVDATRAGVIQSVANISCIDRVKEAGADFLTDLETYVAAL